MASKDPLTTHVLNTVTGRPAAELQVRLTLLEPRFPTDQDASFLATTDADGRIGKWTAQNPSLSMDRIFEEVGTAAESGGRGEKKRLLWHLRYEVEKFYGEGQTLFHVVELNVYQDAVKGGHLHVPLLLGPWNYTTYRGS